MVCPFDIQSTKSAEIIRSLTMLQLEYATFSTRYST